MQVSPNLHLEEVTGYLMYSLGITYPAPYCSQGFRLALVYSDLNGQVVRPRPLM